MTLKDTPLGTPEQFNVIVEIPKGSPDKIQYDELKDEMYVDFTFKNGFKFAYNYGFIPETKAGDGDTLDVIVLSSESIPSGIVVKCRAIGVMKQLDRGEQDDKILAVPVSDKNSKYQSIKDVSETERQEFRDFYAEIGRQKEKIVEITSFEDKDRAMEEIRKARI